MKNKIAALIGGLVLAFPATAGFEPGRTPTMTCAQISGAMGAPGGMFTEGGRLFRILPGEGASEPIATGEVFTAFGPAGDVPGTQRSATRWSFSHQMPMQQDEFGNWLMNTGMSGRIHFVVEELTLSLPDKTEEKKGSHSGAGGSSAGAGGTSSATAV